MRRLALAPTLVCAFLSPQAAFGIGLGDIELQSALNQPLDAEIPLRGVSPGEGDDVVVALASEEAFRQVGLQRPFSLTHLAFTINERNGSHFIQISSREPISEPFLSFLIEVDAREGNLLREYTVLLDPPVFASRGPDEAARNDEHDTPAAGARERTTAAVADAAGAGAGDPGTAMRGRIEPAEAETEADADAGTASGPGELAVSGDAAGPEATEAGVGDQTSTGADAAGAGQGEFGDTPLFLQVAREEEEAERQLTERARAAVQEATTADASSTATAQAEAPASAPPDEYGAVERGETLWDIAEQLRQGEVSVQQMMVALLRYNPEAFDEGNVNRLKEGYVLSVPDAEAARSISTQQAIASVREQNGLWREWRDGLESGGATQLASTQDGQADPAGDARGGGDSGSTAADPGGDSRLDIVGADDGGGASDESSSATASADAGASEELAMAREELASVRAERAELADRVAQLEDTVDKMEQLVTVREDQLARLQQQLEQLQQDAGSSAAGTVADAGSATDPDGVADSGDGDGAAANDSGDDDALAAAGPGGGDGAGGSGAGEGRADTTAGADSGAAGDDGASAQSASAGVDGEQGTSAQTSASDEPQTVTPTSTPPPQQSWLDTMFGLFASVGALVSGTLAGITSGGLSPVVLGAAAFLVLALAWLVVRRRRAARAEADEEAFASSAAIAGADIEPDEAVSGAVAGASTADADDGFDVTDDAVAMLMDDDFDPTAFDAGADADAQPAADDTLAEADTYLAYGLHQQAEDLLRLAIEESPERHDYHEKLLEALYIAARPDAFTSAADRFRNVVDDVDAPAWQRVRAMGQEIAPQHALFSGTAATGAGVAAAADGDDDVELDIDLDVGLDGAAGDDSFTQALLAEAENAATADAPAEPVAAAGAPTTDADDDLEFDLSDLDDAPPPAASSPPSSQAQVDPGIEFDISDLGLDDNGAAMPAATQAAPSGGTDGNAIDTGLDFDLGELGDIGALDAGEGEGEAAESAPEVPATPGAAGDAGAGLDDVLDLDLDLGADDDTDTGLDLDGGFDFENSGLADNTLGDSAGGGPAGALDPSDLDGPSAAAPDAGDDSLAGAVPGRTDELDGAGAGEVPVVDFDFSSLEQELDQAGAASGGESGGDDTPGEDLATMLDLAKAYIDMGDAESAANALEEVIAGGNDQQRVEAQTLLETVQ